MAEPHQGARGAGSSVRGGPASGTPGAVDRHGGALTELTFVAVGLACYLLVDWYTVDRTAQAVSNARDVRALEELLRVDWEHAIQDATMAVPWLSTFCTHYYVWGYFPVLIGTLTWLYLRHLDSYRTMRNALFVSALVGFFVYATYPCAPPWVVGDGFTDTVTDASLDSVARAFGTSNVLGAIPSFHVGWLVLAGLVVFRTTRSRTIRTLCVLQPAVMAYAVVATGNHWVLDIPAGLALAAVGLAAAAVLPRRPLT